MPDRTVLGTGDWRSKSGSRTFFRYPTVTRSRLRFSLPDHNPSNRPRSNPRPRKVRFSVIRDPNPAPIRYPTVTRSCSLGSPDVWDVTSDLTRSRDTRGTVSRAQNNRTLHIPPKPGGSSRSDPLPLIYLRNLHPPRSPGEFCNAGLTFFNPGTAHTRRPG